MRKLTNEQEVVEAAGANIGELIDDLDKTFPASRSVSAMKTETFAASSTSSLMTKTSVSSRIRRLP